MKKIIRCFDGNVNNTSGISLNLKDMPVEWSKTTTDYDIAIYVGREAFSQEIDPNKINCIWLLEPPVINGEHYIYAARDHKKFDYIFSFITEMGNKVDNYVYIPAGGTWLRSEDICVHQKTKNISTAFSWKNWNRGHNMRHTIYSTFKESKKIDFFGSGCEVPVDFKVDTLKDYRFSITIENSVESVYFTEKLLDCFLTGTIPVYWGTKDIGKYFDTNGVVFINDENELSTIIDSFNADLYNSKIDAIQNNYILAKKYIHPEEIIDNFLKEKYQ